MDLVFRKCDLLPCLWQAESVLSETPTWAGNAGVFLINGLRI